MLTRNAAPASHGGLQSGRATGATHKGHPYGGQCWRTPFVTPPESIANKPACRVGCYFALTAFLMAILDR